MCTRINQNPVSTFNRQVAAADFPDEGDASGNEAAAPATVVARMTQRTAASSRLELARLCLWGIGELALPSLWDRLESALGPRSIAQVAKVARVRQASGKFRFDVFVAREACLAVETVLRNVSRQNNWHIRRHVAPGGEGRQLAGSATLRPQLSSSANNDNKLLRLVSWNINGLRNKRTDFEYFLQVVKPAVVGIQETRRLPQGWRLRFNGYQCLERACTNPSGGEHGIALLTSGQFSLSEVGDVSPFWIFGRIVGGGLQKPLLVGTAYMPSNNRAVWEDLKGTLDALLRREKGVAGLVLLGDFNCSSRRLSKKLLQWRLPLAVVGVSGPAATWHQPSRGQSSIDHILVSTGLLSRALPAKVDRSWDLSDHWPLMGRLDRNGSAEPEEVRFARAQLRINREKLKSCGGDFATSNYWQPLLQQLQDGELQIDQAGTAFVDTCISAAKATGVMEESVPTMKREQSRALSHRTKNAIERRRRLYRQLQAASDADVRRDLSVRYAQAKKAASAMAREERLAGWKQHVCKASRLFEEGQLRDLWRWIQGFTGRGKSSIKNVIQPVVDPVSQRLVTDPEKIGKVWARHYARLACDETGHSRDSGHWQQFQVPVLAPLADLNQAVDWQEVYAALKRMASGAPGSDGISTDLLKAAYRTEPSDSEHAQGASDEAEETEEGERTTPPPTLLGKTLVALCCQMFDNSEVPECWNSASVVSIPKKGGDATLPDTYRGISLIAVALKLVCSIVIGRINASLEKADRLRREQAGFRCREECSGQSVALYEILLRRKLAGKKSYVCFIDFKKAYDTVPHEALFLKLERIGVNGKALAFIRELYANSKITVRGAFGESPMVDLLRGLRQGCPMSPILFDVFINDILDGANHLGVRVDGLFKRVPGLLFADDLVLLASTGRKLSKLMKHAEAWANRWEMGIGAAKCGVMVVGGSDDRARRREWKLQGQTVQVVDKYTYLGNLFTNDLCLKAMAAARAAQGRKALYAVQPFLSCQSVPLHFRLMTLKAVILPTCLYGAELWGMNAVLCEPVQKLCNTATRWLYGAGAKSPMIPLVAAQEELQLRTVHSTAAGLRARAYAKFPTLRTWVAELVKNPLSCRKATWVSGASRWLQRFTEGRVALAQAANQLTGTAADKPERLWFERTRTAVWERARAQDRTKAYERYKQACYAKTKTWVRTTAKHPGVSQGFTLLGRARIGAMTTVRRLAQMGFVPQEYEDKCPCCLMDVPETVAHLLVECRRWNGIRRELLGEVLTQIRAAVAASGAVADEVGTVAALLSGGETGGVSLKGWAKLASKSADMSAQSDAAPVDGAGSEVETCALVATFLQRIWHLRLRVVNRLTKGVVANNNRASSSPRADAPVE
jgi:exonuclease III